jgi:voltage-gated potassium channel Kch
MKEDAKSALVFLAFFGAIPFLYFHAFIFSIIYYDNSLEIAFFVALPLMWLCFSRIMRYMPKSMHHIMRRGKTGVDFKKPSLPIYIEALIWYPIIGGIYYHLHLRFLLLSDLDSVGDGVISLLSGYGAFFIASLIGGVVSVFVIENASSLKKDVTQEQFKIIRNRLVSVLVLYFGVILIFSGIYRWISENIEGSFSKAISSTIDSIYFSTVTITTLGYGDITPTSVASKLVVVFQSIMGVLLLAVLIGLVISVSLSQSGVIALDQEKDEAANK